MRRLRDRPRIADPTTLLEIASVQLDPLLVYSFCLLEADAQEALDCGLAVTPMTGFELDALEAFQRHVQATIHESVDRAMFFGRP